MTNITQSGLNKTDCFFGHAGNRKTSCLLLASLGVCLLYVLAAHLGLTLAVVHGNVTAFWPPSGIALAALLLLGVRVWPAIAAGALLANLWAGAPVMASLLIAAGNTLAGLTGAYMIRLVNGRRNPVESVLGLFALVLCGALLATTVSATVGATTLMAHGLATGAEFSSIWLTWWLGDTAGVILFTPLFLAWGRLSAFRVSWHRWRFAEGLLLAATLVLIAQLVFGGWFTTGATHSPLAFLPLPLLILAAFRFGLRGATAGVVIISALATWGTVLGYGPFARPDLNDALLLLQVFMGVTSITTLLIAAILHERDMVAQQLQHAQQQMVTDLGQILEESLNEIYIFDADSFQFLKVNQGARDNLGYTMKELRQLRPVDIQTEFTQEACSRTLVPLLDGSTERICYVTTHRRKDGSSYPVEVHLQLAQLGDRQVYTAIVLDISERLVAEEKLRQAAIVFDNSTEGILIVDIDLTVTGVNRALCSMTGRTQADILGSKAGCLELRLQGQNVFEAVRQRLLDHGHWQGQVDYYPASGEVLACWMSVTEVRDRSGALTHYVSVISDQSMIRLAEEQVNQLAYYDSLTRLPNRLLFNDRLKQAIRQGRRQNRQVALMFLDLDGFKKINDTLGHPAGDSVLQKVARRLMPAVREDDTVARLAGDEFTIVLEGIGDPVQVVGIAERLLQIMSPPFTVDGREVFLTTSIGISLFPQDGDNVTDLMKHADTAMYRAKVDGGNCYLFYHDEMTVMANERLTLETNLRRALDAQEFFLHYQPVISLETGSIVALEALLRWQSPELGCVPPDRFIPLAEQTGMIERIGAWVLRTACRQALHWSNLYDYAPSLSVNLSGHQLSRDDFCGTVKDILAETGFDPGQLELEIAESCLRHENTQAVQNIRMLQELGVRIAIDDFGAGYSSMSALKNTRVDKLKIDRSLVSGIPHNDDDMAIAKAIISLGHLLGVTVTAEGVQTQAQREFLLTSGCDEMQGYLFSRPRPVAEIQEMLHQEGRSIRAIH